MSRASGPPALPRHTYISQIYRVARDTKKERKKGAKEGEREIEIREGIRGPETRLEPQVFFTVMFIFSILTSI